MKYKEGDLVRIKTWESMEKEFGLNLDRNINCPHPVFIKRMEEELNKISPNRIVMISKLHENCIFPYYYIKNYENQKHRWTDDMIEGIEIIDPKERINNRFEILDL